MKKLTIDQAAEELGIKRGSVYKRVWRGTLPSTKGSDGKLYVYMDNIETRNKTPDKRSLYRFLVEVVVPVSSIAAGTLAGLAALLYGLGLLVLWIPIANSYTSDLTSAWYAAALVPKTVVIGLGMAQLLGWPAYYVLFWIFALLTHIVPFYVYWRLKRVRARRRERRGESTGAGIRWTIWGAMLLLVTVQTVTIFPSSGRDVTETVPALAFLISVFLTWFGVAWFVSKSVTLNLSAMVAETLPRWSRLRDNLRDFFLGGFLEVGILAQFLSKPAPGDKLRLLPGWRLNFIKIAMVFFSFGIFTQVLNIAQRDYTPLPSVEITGPSATTGVLLSHTDGTWYILNEEGEIVAIPGDKVDAAHVFSERR